jgi:hypothetical protein
VIPQEVRDHPTAALDDPRFAKPEAEPIYREELPCDPLGLCDLYRRVGILERELGNWGEPDRAHHLALSLGGFSALRQAHRPPEGPSGPADI